MTAPTRPLHRVTCACGWVGYRVHPTGRACPGCADEQQLRPVWLAGCAPRRGRCAYLAHLWPPLAHASHYLGKPSSSGLLKALWWVSGREFAELSPDRTASLDQMPNAIRSRHLQLDRPVRQGAIDDLCGAQLLPFRRVVDEVAHIPGRARNVAVDQVQPCLLVSIAALDAHELADQVDQLVSAQPLRHGANDDPAGDRGPASGAGPRSGDIQRGAGGPATQYALRRVHPSRTGPAFPGDRAGIVPACRESYRPAQAPPTGCLTWDSRREPQPYAAANCRQIQQFTIDLPRRWPEHLAGGYDPATHKATGKGARLLAAALHAGHQVELVRVWYGAQARTLEQRLKQPRQPGSLRAGAARSLKPLCPVCNPAGWWRRYPDLPDPPPPPRPGRFTHDPQVWDADREWDLAFPHLAYGPPPPAAAALQAGGVG